MKLYRYILRRLFLIIPVLLGVSIIVFSLNQITGDPAAAFIGEKMTPTQIQLVKEKYHFDEPPIVQYWYWLQGIMQGDWGWSKVATLSVTDSIMKFFPNTFQLAVIALLIAVTVGIAAGTRAAIKRNKAFDQLARVFSLVGISIPLFFFALLMQFFFSFYLKILPSGGLLDNSYLAYADIPNGPTRFLLLDTLIVGNFDMFLNAAQHLILPAMALSLSTIAVVLRMQRNSMLEVLGLDYIKTARAKGLPEKTVIRKHARKNALIPTTTVVGLSFGSLLGGAVITETIFFYPGLGLWATQSISSADNASILGFCLLVALIFVVVNLIVDILYAYLDPRVRLG
jgi:peptide/nickel transport system permease protein